MSFATRLKEQRERMGLTQVQLAQALGVTKGAIGNYETGCSSPKADNLYRLFDILKCDANYLFQDEMKELERDDFTIPEIKMVKKYRTLDEYGKEAVDSILAIEHKRCAEKSETPVQLPAAARTGIDLSEEDLSQIILPDAESDVPV